MTKIISRPNCDNSPKMEFLKEFNSAFAKADIKYLSECVTNDITWDNIGEKKTVGKENFLEELEKMKAYSATELVIEKIITHGKEGAASGVMTMQNKKRYAFSDIYEFNSAAGKKIKSITSYVIEI